MDETPWVPKLSPKQLAVFNCYKRYVCCAGGRRNGKSVGVGHKVIRHMWETPGAEVALIATTIKSAKEQGAFQDLISIILPDWIGSNMVGIGGLPMDYTSKSGNGLPGPRTDAATRTSSFKIRNYWGGESQLMLFSIDNENEVESITKSKRFSMVWLSEGANFKSKDIFKNLIQMLRMFGLPFNQHQLIVDTNPAEEGDEHWIYKEWYVNRLRDKPPKEMLELKNPITQEDWELQRSNLELFEFFLEDNIFLSKEEIAELKATNCDNQGDYDRNVLGKWVKGHGLKGKVFADIIDTTKHFLGTTEDEWITLSENTIELIVGWDPGQVNHAAAIVEKIVIDKMRIYNLIDEVVLTDEKIGTAAFAYTVWEKMRYIEQFYQKRFKWTHWADSSVFDWRASIENYDSEIIREATEGQVIVEGVDKPKDSVKYGIRMMRRALFENRLFIGANCPKHKEMMLDLKDTDIEEDTFLKHPFDALRYVIYMEERKHLQNPNESTPKVGSKSNIIHVT